jgi:hypothetical protein
MNRRGVHQQSRLFALQNPRLKHSPSPTGFAEFVGDDFPALHCGDWLH